MRREHRRELKHDKFVQEMGSLSAKARDNQGLLLSATVAIVAVVLLGYGLYFYRSTREQRAQQLLATAVETIDSPLLPAPGGQPVPGNMHTVGNTGLGAAFESRTGASFRLIADLSTTPPALWAVDSQSESGHPG